MAEATTLPTANPQAGRQAAARRPPTQGTLAVGGRTGRGPQPPRARRLRARQGRDPRERPLGARGIVRRRRVGAGAARRDPGARRRPVDDRGHDQPAPRAGQDGYALNRHLDTLAALRALPPGSQVQLQDARTPVDGRGAGPRPLHDREAPRRPHAHLPRRGRPPPRADRPVGAPYSPLASRPPSRHPHRPPRRAAVAAAPAPEPTVAAAAAPPVDDLLAEPPAQFESDAWFGTAPTFEDETPVGPGRRVRGAGAPARARRRSDRRRRSRDLLAPPPEPVTADRDVTAEHTIVRRVAVRAARPSPTRPSPCWSRQSTADPAAAARPAGDAPPIDVAGTRLDAPPGARPSWRPPATASAASRPRRPEEPPPSTPTSWATTAEPSVAQARPSFPGAEAVRAARDRRVRRRVRRRAGHAGHRRLRRRLRPRRHHRHHRARLRPRRRHRPHRDRRPQRRPTTTPAPTRRPGRRGSTSSIRPRPAAASTWTGAPATPSSSPPRRPGIRPPRPKSRPTAETPRRGSRRRGTRPPPRTRHPPGRPRHGTPTRPRPGPRRRRRRPSRSRGVEAGDGAGDPAVGDHQPRARDHVGDHHGARAHLLGLPHLGTGVRTRVGHPRGMAAAGPRLRARALVGDDEGTEPQSDEAATYETPTYETPTYEAPTYEAPTYEAPAFDAPAFENHPDEAPTFETAFPAAAWGAPAAGGHHPRPPRRGHLRRHHARRPRGRAGTDQLAPARRPSHRRGGRGRVDRGGRGIGRVGPRHHRRARQRARVRAARRHERPARVRRCTHRGRARDPARRPSRRSSSSSWSPAPSGSSATRCRWSRCAARAGS